MQAKSQKSQLPERKIICDFCSSYRVLFVLFLISMGVSVVYICDMAFILPEVLPGGSELLSFLYNLSLAFIANTIFCYFQVHRPAYIRKNSIRNAVQQSIMQIKHLISFRIENIYYEKYGERVALENISSDKLESLFTNMLSRKSCVIKKPDCNIQKCECFTNFEALGLTCTEVSDLCTHILAAYAPDLSKDIISALEHIYKSFFVSFFRSNYPRMEGDNSWSDLFLTMQRPYTEQLQAAYKELLHCIEK